MLLYTGSAHCLCSDTTQRALHVDGSTSITCTHRVCLNCVIHRRRVYGYFPQNIYTCLWNVTVYEQVEGHLHREHTGTHTMYMTPVPKPHTQYSHSAPTFADGWFACSTCVYARRQYSRHRVCTLMVSCRECWNILIIHECTSCLQGTGVRGELLKCTHPRLGEDCLSFPRGQRYRSPVFSQNLCDNSGPEKMKLFVCDWLGGRTLASLGWEPYSSAPTFSIQTCLDH